MSDHQRPLRFEAPEKKAANQLVSMFDSNPWGSRGLNSREERLRNRSQPPSHEIPMAAADAARGGGRGRGGGHRAFLAPYSELHPGRYPTEMVPGSMTAPAGGMPHGMRQREAPRSNTSSMAVTPADRKRELVINEDNIIRVADVISQRMGRTLTILEQNEIMTVMRGMNYNVLSDKRISDINEHIAGIVYKNIQNYICRDSVADSRMRWSEAVKSNLAYADAQAAANNITNISNVSQSCCDEFYMVSTLIFDSRYADIVEFPISNFPFVVSAVLGGGGTLGKVASPTEITNMRKLTVGDFDIPYVKSLDNSETDQVAVLFEKQKAQSYQTPTGSAFHFLFNKEVIGNRIRLHVVPGYETYTFGQAITSLSDVNIVFLDGVRPVQLPRNQEVNATFVSIAGPPAQLEVTTANPHGMSTGDLAYFENFRTSPATYSSDENVLNDIRGHRITNMGTNVFTVNVDMTASTLIFLAGWNIFYGNQRWRMPTKATFIRPISYQTVSLGEDA
tara:strand:+ start:34513 stop:36030 length:1518 start_codon:yes stop_codon:yes gene_type:complete